jgi:hypothetical protein
LSKHLYSTVLIFTVKQVTTEKNVIHFYTYIRSLWATSCWSWAEIMSTNRKYCSDDNIERSSTTYQCSTWNNTIFVGCMRFLLLVDLSIDNQEKRDSAQQGFKHFCLSLFSSQSYFITEIFLFLTQNNLFFSLIFTKRFL